MIPQEQWELFFTWRASCSQLFLWPSIIDIFINPGGHNLWPFEFAMYLGYALPTILALYLGRFVTTRIVKRKIKPLRSIDSNEKNVS